MPASPTAFSSGTKSPTKTDERLHNQHSTVTVLPHSRRNFKGAINAAVVNFFNQVFSSVLHFQCRSQADSAVNCQSKQRTSSDLSIVMTYHVVRARRFWPMLGGQKKRSSVSGDRSGARESVVSKPEPSPLMAIGEMGLSSELSTPPVASVVKRRLRPWRASQKFVSRTAKSGPFLRQVAWCLGISFQARFFLAVLAPFEAGFRRSGRGFFCCRSPAFGGRFFKVLERRSDVARCDHSNVSSKCGSDGIGLPAVGVAGAEFSIEPQLGRISSAINNFAPSARQQSQTSSTQLSNGQTPPRSANGTNSKKKSGDLTKRGVERSERRAGQSM